MSNTDTDKETIADIGRVANALHAAIELKLQNEEKSLRVKLRALLGKWSMITSNMEL